MTIRYRLWGREHSISGPGAAAATSQDVFLLYKRTLNAPRRLLVELGCCAVFLICFIAAEGTGDLQASRFIFTSALTSPGPPVVADGPHPQQQGICGRICVQIKTLIPTI